MPAKNSLKQFVENGYYHLYNRGVEKRTIFQDDQDYHVFQKYLKDYLGTEKGTDPHPISKEVDLLAFCLMPNHYHLLVKQNSISGITKLIRAVCTNYSMYFNKKYDRVGTLFQGRYKAILVENDRYLLHLSRYIHLNPYPGSVPKNYSHSSYQYYIGDRNLSWVKSKEILGHFKSAKKSNPSDILSYEGFVEDFKEDTSEVLGNLTLEDLE